MSTDAYSFAPLDAFLGPMLGLPAWDVKHGHGSFLTFQFGEPRLVVRERRSGDGSLRRLAYARGETELWIYCCAWRCLDGEAQLAWSEDDDSLIDRAAARLDGQKLVRVALDPASGRSAFDFDLGGRLETWPNDPADRQWSIGTATESFAYRGDGCYSRLPNDVPIDSASWLPLK